MARIARRFFVRRIGTLFQEISELRLAQADGGLPTVVAAGSTPGESGVFVFSPRFHGGAHVSATPMLFDLAAGASGSVSLHGVPTPYWLGLWRRYLFRERAGCTPKGRARSTCAAATLGAPARAARRSNNARSCSSETSSSLMLSSPPA